MSFCLSVLRVPVGVMVDASGRWRGEDAPGLCGLRQHLSKTETDAENEARVGGDF